MKLHIAVISVFLLAGSLLRAQVALPDLTIKEQGEKQSLDLQELAVEVRIEGRLVETVLELKFFNHSKRMQEGEFVLQLPPGATVSTYALEIKGRMRAGVAVEKDRARNAYESIKRRMVDPGLVEREKGNIYRTRIFPIEALKSKRVRIGFIQTLPADGKYIFPLHCDDLLEKFSCVVQGTNIAPLLSSEGLPDGSEKIDPEQWQWQAEKVKLDGKLEVKSGAVEKMAEPAKPKIRIDRQGDGAAYFLIQGKISEGKAPIEIDDKNPGKWKKIRLIWDASYSRRGQTQEVQEAEFAALRRIWEWQDECEVSLHLLGIGLGKARTFKLGENDGAIKKLEKALSEVSYDGAADFSKITPWDGVTLLVTDGKVSSPIWNLDDGQPIEDYYLITSTAGRVAPGLLKSNATWIDLRSDDWWDRLTRTPIKIGIKGGPPGPIDVTRSGDYFIVSGRLPTDFTGEIIVRPPRSKQIVITGEGRSGGNEEQWSFLRRVWAQRRLSVLEAEGNKASIIAFAESERLVSDFTSLIVLERFEDHLRYRIPPPEPDLLSLYKQRVGAEEDAGRVAALRAWREKNAWYNTKFSWLDGELEEELRMVAIWVKSSKAAFPKTKRNQQALQPFEKWLPEARQVIAAKDSLSTGKEFKNWQSQVGQRMKDLDGIREQEVKVNPKQVLYVSVRGFVRAQEVYSGAAPFGLREAVEKAGGPNYYGSWQRVYLYRGAQRTGYNLESDGYTDVKLRWGDMIVVENVPYRYPPTFLTAAGGLGVDPFASPGDFGSAADPFADPDDSMVGSAGDPVFEQAGEAQVRQEQVHPAWAPRLSVGGSQAYEGTVNGEAGDGGALEQVEGIDPSLLKSLQDHPNPAKKYADLLKGKFGQRSVSMATVIELARFFFARKEADLGQRILSNLCELQSNPVEATRSYAYWLAELGETQRAIEIFTALAEVVPDEASRAIIYFDLGQISEQANFFGKSVEAEMMLGEKSSLPAIALTDYFASDGKAKGEAENGANGTLSGFKKNAMPSDVRIVITSVGGRSETEIVEPSDFGVLLDHGGRLLKSDRVQEYQVRRALPGPYKVSLMHWEADFSPLTIHVRYYIRWASGKQEKRTRTMLMEERRLQLDDVIFGWGE